MSASSRDPGTLYRKLVEHMNEGVWMGDAQERTIYANPKFCEMVGYTLPEMLGKQSYVFWDPESAKRVRQINEGERRRGVSSSYEGMLMTKYGERIPVLLSGTPLPDGGTIGIMTDLRDLRKQQETEMILGHAIAQSNEAIILIGEDWTIQSWNRGAASAFGYAKARVLQKPLSVILPGLDTAAAAKARNRVELDGRHQGGGRIKLAATFSKLPANSQGLAYLMIARDITAQVRFEEELSVKYDKLSDAYNQFGIIRRQMDYVFELAELCAQENDLKTLADYAVSSIIMLSRVDACTLRLRDSRTNTLVLTSSFGLAEGDEGRRQIPYPGSLAEKAFRMKRPMKIIDLAHEPLYRSLQWAKKHNFTSALIIALSFRSEFVGSLTLYVTPAKKLELFENTFVERYAEVLGIILATWRKDR